MAIRSNIWLRQNWHPPPHRAFHDIETSKYSTPCQWWEKSTKITLNHLNLLYISGLQWLVFFWFRRVSGWTYYYKWIRLFIFYNNNKDLWKEPLKITHKLYFSFVRLNTTTWLAQKDFRGKEYLCFRHYLHSSFIFISFIFIFKLHYMYVTITSLTYHLNHVTMCVAFKTSKVEVLLYYIIKNNRVLKLSC